MKNTRKGTNVTSSTSPDNDPMMCITAARRAFSAPATVLDGPFCWVGWEDVSPSLTCLSIPFIFVSTEFTAFLSVPLYFGQFAAKSDPRENNPYPTAPNTLI